MTKTKLGQSETKTAGFNAAPTYTAVQLGDPPAQTNLPGTTCWYVFGILSTIFCCLPCGVVGLVHALIAKHEGERGNLPAHRSRMTQAKCWISWSIILGVLFVITATLWFIGATIGFSRTYNYFCERHFVDDYYYGNWNETQWNETATPKIIWVCP